MIRGRVSSRSAGPVACLIGVRRYHAWYAPITLAMATAPFLTAADAQEAERGDSTQADMLIRLSGNPQCRDSLARCAVCARPCCREPYASKRNASW